MLGLLSGSTFFLTVAPTRANPQALSTAAPALEFREGVASGDPQPTSIMLWTRAAPPKEHTGKVTLLLQVSADKAFSRLELQAPISTEAANDYTVRSYVDGLRPDTIYYYRFIGGAATKSRVGRTRTAPTADQTRKVNLAFASCQNYEQAHYGAWARMLEEDRKAPQDERIDFVLHLGDFIYERSWKKRSDGATNPRALPPFPDGVDSEEYRHAVSLADYRMLYRTYLSDPHLQEARAQWPFICTWDDHEFANDNHQSFTTYDDGKARPEPQRKISSNQAWFEYIPAVLDESDQQPAHNFRPPSPDGKSGDRNEEAVNSLCIYRQLRWGKYLDIILTDSRSYRSPDCLPSGFASVLGVPLNPVELVAIADAGKAYNNGSPPDLLPFGDGSVANPAKNREPGTILGSQQRSWMLAKMAGSTANWKLWGNALPLLPMRLDLSALPFTGYHDSIFNLDSWGGYPYEVHYIMDQLETQEITGVVSLSGDHHMHGAGTVSRSTTDPSAQPVIADFSIAGISSSPLFHDLVAATTEDPAFAPLVYRESDKGTEPLWNMSLVDGALAAYTYAQTGLESLANWLGPNLANPGLRYVDCTANGYGLASFDADKMDVRMLTLEDCGPDFTKPPAIAHVAKFDLPRWEPGKQPELTGPDFEGGRPFPFNTNSV